VYSQDAIFDTAVEGVVPIGNTYHEMGGACKGHKNQAAADLPVFFHIDGAIIIILLNAVIRLIAVRIIVTASIVAALAAHMGIPAPAVAALVVRIATVACLRGA
jgi:hypothetical protein